MEPNDRPGEADAAASPFEPTEILIEERRSELRLAWADGHTSNLPYPYLRGFCPCAACQGHGGDLAFVEPTLPLVLREVLEVGHYAINLVWQDGHRTGIYALDYLRSLCPCEACQRRMGKNHVLGRLPEKWCHTLELTPVDKTK